VGRTQVGGSEKHEKGVRNMREVKLRAIWEAVVLAGVFVAFSTCVFANSSSYYDKDGATVFPIENKSIVMQKELVRIEPAIGDDRTWRAVCEFIFYNKSDSEESVTMGYPDWLNASFNPEEDKAFWNYFDTLPPKEKKKYKENIFVVGYGYDEVYIRGYKEGEIPYVRKAWNLHDLKVTFDGAMPRTTHKAIVEKKSLPGDGAYIWKVIFKPHETKTITVSFSFSGDNEVEGYQRATYIMRTGALWADKISVADIYWNVAGRKINLRQVVPHGYKIENNIIHWHFEDFKPKGDIVISRWKRFMDSALDCVREIYCSKKYEGDARYYGNGDLESNDLEKKMKSNVEDIQNKARRLYTRALRNEIYARHGREFNSLEILDVFGNCDWYKPDSDYSDNMLNEYEKKNIKFILDYEKQKGWQ
jgi:hypothetical protein